MTNFQSCFKTSCTGLELVQGEAIKVQTFLSKFPKIQVSPTWAALKAALNDKALSHQPAACTLLSLTQPIWSVLDSARSSLEQLRPVEKRWEKLISSFYLQFGSNKKSSLSHAKPTLFDSFPVAAPSPSWSLFWLFTCCCCWDDVMDVMGSFNKNPCVSLIKFIKWCLLNIVRSLRSTKKPRSRKRHKTS